MQEISLSPYKPKRGEAFEIAFVYSDKGNFAVKGMSNEVIDFLNREFRFYIANRTFWKNGKSHRFWVGGPRTSVVQIQPNRRYLFSVDIGGIQRFRYRRMPKLWLPEWTKILEENPEPSRYRATISRTFDDDYESDPYLRRIVRGYDDDYV